MDEWDEEAAAVKDVVVGGMVMASTLALAFAWWTMGILDISAGRF